MKKIFLAVSLLVLSGAALAQTFEDGVAAYEQDDFARAIYIWNGLAEQGHLLAQYNLGLMYENGTGTPVRADVAAFWYRMAGLQGHDMAQYNLGGLYFSGSGVPQDPDEAKRWWEMAANTGNPYAQFNLAVYYLKHAEDEDRVEQAMIRLNQAAQTGHADAANLLHQLQQLQGQPTSIFFGAPPGENPAAFSSNPNPAPGARISSLRSYSETHSREQILSGFAGREWLEAQYSDYYTVEIAPFEMRRGAENLLNDIGASGPGSISFDGKAYRIHTRIFKSKKEARHHATLLKNTHPELKNFRVRPLVIYMALRMLR